MKSVKWGEDYHLVGVILSTPNGLYWSSAGKRRRVYRSKVREVLYVEIKGVRHIIAYLSK